MGAPVGPPVAPPQKRSGWKIPLIIGGVVLGLCCLGAIALGIWGLNTFREATGPTRDSAVAYLEDIERNDYGSAYNRLCGELRSDMNQQEFAQVQSLLPKVTGHKVTGVNINNTNGNVTGTVNVLLTREGVGELQQEIRLVKESGDWKVCQRGI